jgi:hypothetical protein
LLFLVTHRTQVIHRYKLFCSLCVVVVVFLFIYLFLLILLFHVHRYFLSRIQERSSWTYCHSGNGCRRRPPFISFPYCREEAVWYPHKGCRRILRYAVHQVIITVLTKTNDNRRSRFCFAHKTTITTTMLQCSTPSFSSKNTFWWASNRS